MQSFFSHGKFLLTGEYFVLYGAKALAIPLKLGQKTNIEKISGNEIIWKSFYKENNWFQAKYSVYDFEILETSDINRANYAQKQLRSLKLLSKENLFSTGLKITHFLDFNPAWGMGSSSTLINNLASWAKIDAHHLNASISKGSGYDISCASAKNPIFFQRKERIFTEKARFHPNFKENLYFLYLEKKQDTEKNIQQFLASKKDFTKEIDEISKISEAVCEAKNLWDFTNILKKHEQIVGSAINEVPVQEKLFSDFSGFVKSLGSWGGDFVLVVSENPENDKQYFQQKGYNTFLNYKELEL